MGKVETVILTYNDSNLNKTCTIAQQFRKSQRDLYNTVIPDQDKKVHIPNYKSNGCERLKETDLSKFNIKTSKHCLLFRVFLQRFILLEDVHPHSDQPITVPSIKLKKNTNIE